MDRLREDDQPVADVYPAMQPSTMNWPQDAVLKHADNDYDMIDYLDGTGDYESLSIRNLKILLGNRKRSTEGDKSTLIERLRRSDGPQEDVDQHQLDAIKFYSTGQYHRELYTCNRSGRRRSEGPLL